MMWRLGVWFDRYSLYFLAAWRWAVATYTIMLLRKSVPFWTWLETQMPAEPFHALQNGVTGVFLLVMVLYLGRSGK